MKYFLIVSTLVLSSGFFADPSFALAQGTSYPNPISASDIGELIYNILGYLRDKVVGPLSVLVLIIAGFLYASAYSGIFGDSEKRLKQAHQALLWGISGIAIVFGAHLITAFLFGVGKGAIAGSFENFVQAMARLIGNATMAVSVLMIIYSGYLYVVEAGMQGDKNAHRRAIRTLTFALVGVGVATLAFVVPRIIASFIGGIKV